MVTFLLSPLGKYAIYAMSIILACGLIFGWYEMKLSEAKRDALASYNATQLEQVLSEKDQAIRQLKNMQAYSDVLKTQNDKLNDEVNNKGNQATIVIEKFKVLPVDPMFNAMLKKLK